jgi:8-oxo-dGTP diphosphatase
MIKVGASERLVAGVLRLNGQMLLCHRRSDRSSWPNVWDLPGGHIDDGETSAEALVRELEEELGVEIEPPHDPPWMTLHSDHVELLLYLVDRWTGEPHNAAPEEHDDIRWFAPDGLQLIDLADASYAAILRQAFVTSQDE